MSSAVSWQDTEFFKASTEDVLARIRETVGEVKAGAGEAFFSEGDPASALFLLKSGLVELTYTLPTHRDTTVRITSVEPGEVFAWSALAGGTKLTATAVAVEPAEAYVFPAEELRAIMDAEPAFGYRFMSQLARLVARRLGDTRQQLQWLHDSF